MFTKDKSFYKTFFALFRMLVLQNIIVLGVNLVDNIMIGSFSEEALSGVASVNQIQFIFQNTLCGGADALVVLGSQYWGQHKTEPVKKLFSGALMIASAIGALLFIAAALFPYQMVGIFTKSQIFIENGVEYLRVMKYTYLIFAVTNSVLSMLRTVETVKIAFYTSIMTLVINISLNYLLIFGNFGAPQMGVTGAAIATLTARAVELVVVLAYVAFKDKKLNFKIKDLFKPDLLLIGDYVKFSGSFLLVSAMFGCSTALQTVILGHMEDSAIAANSVASTLYQTLKVAAIGASSAASVVIGKTVGTGDIKKVKEYSRTLQMIFIIIGLITSATLYTLRWPIINLYELSDTTKAMANEFLLVLCIASIGMAYQMPTITGIIRGGGDGNFVLINDIISIWCIVLPASFLAAFKFNLSPTVVVFLLNSDQIFKCGAAAIKANRYKFIKKLTR